VRGTRQGVSICGLGAVTGYGWGRKLLWDGLRSSESAVLPRPGYEEWLGHDVAYCAIVPEVERSDGLTRFGAAVSEAADEAIDNALDRGWRPGPVVGVVHAVVLGEVELWRDFYLERNRRMKSHEYLHLMPSTVLSLLMTRHGFHGPVMNVTAMCASGNAAMLTAKMWIDAGVASDVIVVASDLSATPENIRHFRNLGVVYPDAPALDVCRPFQEGSKGFPGGEASVGMVVSGRHEGGYARVLGGAMSHDAYHPTHLNPDHREIRRCYQQALNHAKVFPSEIAYLNAHGPGTAQCDAAEADMLDTLLTEAEVYSVKPLVGHCQGAAAGVELVAACLGYENGVIPAPKQVAPGHERLLDGPTLRRDGLTLKSSIGMGGHNSAVVLADA
jgi:3-oxoacyl-[acyl-carrier-protein] synthase II